MIKLQISFNITFNTICKQNKNIRKLLFFFTKQKENIFDKNKTFFKRVHYSIWYWYLVPDPSATPPSASEPRWEAAIDKDLIKRNDILLNYNDNRAVIIKSWLKNNDWDLGHSVGAGVFYIMFTRFLYVKTQFLFFCQNVVGF